MNFYFIIANKTLQKSKINNQCVNEIHFVKNLVYLINEILQIY